MSDQPRKLWLNQPLDQFPQSGFASVDDKERLRVRRVDDHIELYREDGTVVWLIYSRLN